MHVLQYQHMRKEYLQPPICSFYHHYYNHFYATYKKHCYIIVDLRCALHILCTVIHLIHLLCYPQQYPMPIVLWCYNAKTILQHWALLGCDDDQNPLVVLYSSQHNSSQQLQWMSVSSSSLLLIYLIVLLCYLQESHCAVYLQFPTQLYASFMLIITLLYTKALLYRYIHCKLQQLVAKWRGGKMKLLNRKACLPKRSNAKQKLRPKTLVN